MSTSTGKALYHQSSASRGKMSSNEILSVNFGFPDQSDKRHGGTGSVEVGAWLRQAVLGYYQYYAVPGNLTQLRTFSRRVGWLRRSVLVRRSQRAQVRWDRLYPLLHRWIPRPRVLHPYPMARFAARHPW